MLICPITQISKLTLFFLVQLFRPAAVNPEPVCRVCADLVFNELGDFYDCGLDVGGAISGICKRYFFVNGDAEIGTICSGDRHGNERRACLHG